MRPRIIHSPDRKQPRGYTLLEILVVSAISMILMTVIAYIYSNALRVYEDTQGLSTVYETAKIINRDMRNSLGYCVPVPGNWMVPQVINMPGNPAAVPISPAAATTVPNSISVPTGIDPWYLDAMTAPSSEKTKAVWMTNFQDYDLLFSGSQFRMKTTGDSGLYKGYPPLDDMYFWLYSHYNNPSFPGSASNPQSKNGNYGLRSFWMPAFFGRRDFGSTVNTSTGATTNVLGANDILAGSWGWPRPDYRMDIDLDRTASGTINGNITQGGEVLHYSSPLLNSIPGNPTIACWFYAENRVFNSPFTLALDNSNIVLVSIKFSQKPPQPATYKVNGTLLSPQLPEQTQLSILRHSIVGFDLADSGLLRADETVGNMLRAIKIKPYYRNSANQLAEMSDNELNSHIVDGSPVDPTRANPAGNAIPRCFDIEYSLRNPYNFHRYDFALRVYCAINPQ